MSHRVKPHSTNYDRILGAEGGQIGGGVLAAAAPPPLAFRPPWTSRGLGAFPSIVVRIGVVERLQKRYSNPSNAVSSLACFSIVTDKDGATTRCRDPVPSSRSRV